MIAARAETIRPSDIIANFTLVLWPLRNLFSVRIRVFQLFEIVVLVDLEDENPAPTIGFAVD